MHSLAIAQSRGLILQCAWTRLDEGVVVQTEEIAFTGDVEEVAIGEAPERYLQCSTKAERM